MEFSDFQFYYIFLLLQYMVGGAITHLLKESRDQNMAKKKLKQAITYSM